MIARSFTHHGRRLSYRDFGVGDRVVVLTHGLLMDGRMFAKLIPVLVAQHYRVLVADMLGHGESGQPHDMTAYSMTQYGDDVVALLDHAGVDRAVIGGTSLGANIALEVAVLAPRRVCGLVVEMPVLEHGLAGAGALFVPLALALRVSQPTMRALARWTRRVPRTFFLADLLLDFVRRDPGSSLAILDGVTFGRVAPPPSERRKITQPTLVIGHPSDPIHPFNDADTLARELPQARMIQARSIAEWRTRPARLDAELLRFLDEVWAGHKR